MTLETADLSSGESQFSFQKVEVCSIASETKIEQRAPRRTRQQTQHSDQSVCRCLLLHLSVHRLGDHHRIDMSSEIASIRDKSSDAERVETAKRESQHQSDQSGESVMWLSRELLVVQLESCIGKLLVIGSIGC